MNFEIIILEIGQTPNKWQDSWPQTWLLLESSYVFKYIIIYIHSTLDIFKVLFLGS